MCYETRNQQIARLCYERDDLMWALKSAEKNIEKLLCENEDLKKLCEKQARLNLVNAKLALELDKVKAERDALLARMEAVDDNP